MIRLYHCHQSRSMRSLWLLHELGVEFETIVIPFDKSLRSAEHLARHPVGRVPALEIDGRHIWESGAINEYLCDRFPQAGLGRAPGDAERADWLIWMHYAETISVHAAILTQQHIVIYEDHMRSGLLMRLEAKRLEKCFAAVEAALDGHYLLPGGFSAADIGVGQAIYMAQHFVKPDGFPKLSAWLARLSARPGFQASLPPEGAVLLYRQDFYPPWEEG